jgi:hypothetical protein
MPQMDGDRAPAKNTQIAPGIHDCGMHTVSPQNTDGRIYGVSLRDAAEVESKRPREANAPVG